ncbi:MAG TPA: GIY-YIG nuclease family protein [Candidatus Saccharimonadales bacterium]|nr:GIY-YIG nuclease family protein [Candidatus Saccharimonadales bacterium]
MSWYVYICVSKAGYYYVGISSKPTERLKMHNAGLGAKMAKDQGEFHLEYVSNPFSRQIIRAQT